MNHQQCVCVGLLISKVTGNVLTYPVLHKKMSCLFLSLSIYLLNIMVSTTQTLSQIKSPEIIGPIKQHFMTSPLTYFSQIKIQFESFLDW